MSRWVRVARRFCCFSRSLSCARPCASSPRARALAERQRPSASVSRGVARRRGGAAPPRRRRRRGWPPRQAGADVGQLRPGSRAPRRGAAGCASSSASRRARPMCDCAARAAKAAMAGSTPSRRTSTSATASTGGVTRHDRAAARPDGGQHVLERGRAQDPDGARRRLLDRLEQRVGRAPGEVRALEPVGVLDDHDLPAPRGGRQGGVGARGGGCRRSGGAGRAGGRRSTSGWVPSSTVRQAWQWPQPAGPRACWCTAGRPRTRGAAVLRPEPGGPVNTQACVMPRPGPVPSTTSRAAAAAACSWSTTRSCPTRSSQTPVTGPRCSRQPARATAAATLGLDLLGLGRRRRGPGSGPGPRPRARGTWPGPGRWNSSGSASSRSGAPRAPQPLDRVEVEQHGQVGQQAAGGPAR